MGLLDQLRGAELVRVVPPRVFRTEADAEQYLTRVFAEHFHVHRRLTGQHWTGRTMIADIVLVPREPWGHGDSYRPLLVEVKRDDGIAAVTGAAAQAVDYTQSVWDVRPLHRYLPPAHIGDTERLCAGILLPGVYHRVLGGESQGAPLQEEEGFLMQRLLGRLNVLTISYTRSQGWVVRLSGERVWSQRYGHRGGRWNGAPKVGAR